MFLDAVLSVEAIFLGVFDDSYFLEACSQESGFQFIDGFDGAAASLGCGWSFLLVA